MTKAALKAQIERAIRKTDSQELLELVYSILRGGDTADGKHTSRSQYNKELKTAIEQGKQGKFSSVETIEKKFSKW